MRYASAGTVPQNDPLEWHVLRVNPEASDSIDRVVALFGTQCKDLFTTFFAGSFKPVPGCTAYKNLHCINHVVHDITADGFEAARVNNVFDNIYLYQDAAGAWVVRNSRAPIVRSIETCKDRPEHCLYWKTPHPNDETTIKICFQEATDAAPTTISAAKMRTSLAFTTNIAITKLEPFIPVGIYHLKTKNTRRSQFTRSSYASDAVLYGQSPHSASGAFLALTFEDIDGQPVLHFQKGADDKIRSSGKLGHWVIKNHLNQVYARRNPGEPSTLVHGAPGHFYFRLFTHDDFAGSFA